ncbi:basic proline-rich protein-like isoform X1 [Acinonyx jubatus]|uniref:Basic proline-rich protein-like isoform X1 n=1 Tax=Acinonyx jubatus TaxID=32536 RepID=A0ABM3NSW7_ACIJB|nr:basic proline-rich protein-like isoform X1 [Acinonyx jubatus]
MPSDLAGESFQPPTPGLLSPAPPPPPPASQSAEVQTCISPSLAGRQRGRRGGSRWGHWGGFRAGARRPRGIHVKGCVSQGSRNTGFNSSNWPSRKGPSAHIPPARPPARPGEPPPPPPPPPPGSEGSRRTCPFHCGSLSALPGASPGSPASYLYHTGLLSTHFTIPFQAGDFAAELKLLISVTSFFLSCDLDE